MKLLGVMTTIDDPRAAEQLARVMVERKLAACAQISKIESVYSWDGAIQQEGEYRILYKTTEAAYAELEKAISELHSYDVPAITAFPITHAYEPYADWVALNATPG